jgi:hypothetical protein
MGGCDGGFMLPLAMEGLEYGGTASRLIGDLSRIFGAQPPQGVHRTLMLDYRLQDSPHRLTLDIEPDEMGCLVNFTIRVEGKPEGNIEIWEKGELSLRTSCASFSRGRVFSTNQGTAIAIRHSASSQGAKILLYQTEFSREDWQAAFVSTCIGGHLSKASEILLNRLLPAIGSVGWLEGIHRRISALSAVTKVDGCVLYPIPATRSSSVDQEDRLTAYNLVWNGILQCWPSAADIPNPWSKDPPGSVSTTGMKPSLDQQVPMLVHACIGAARGESMPAANDRDVMSGEPDSRVKDGWAALLGWTALLTGDYRKASEIFQSGGGATNDPFALEVSALLADHLCQSALIETNREQPRQSSDRIWREVLSPLL